MSSARGCTVLNSQNRRSDKSDSLGPGEIQEITKSTQEPDTDLVSTHAHLIDFTVAHQHC